jgi:hypothetical protein
MKILLKKPGLLLKIYCRENLYHCMKKNTIFFVPGGKVEIQGVPELAPQRKQACADNKRDSKLSNSSLFNTRGPLKLSFHSSFKLAHSCQKKPKLHTNELNTTFFCSTSPQRLQIAENL